MEEAVVLHCNVPFYFEKISKNPLFQTVYIQSRKVSRTISRIENKTKKELLFAFFRIKKF